MSKLECPSLVKKIISRKILIRSKINAKHTGSPEKIDWKWRTSGNACFLLWIIIAINVIKWKHFNNIYITDLHQSSADHAHNISTKWKYGACVIYVNSLSLVILLHRFQFITCVINIIKTYNYNLNRSNNIFRMINTSMLSFICTDIIKKFYCFNLSMIRCLLHCCKQFDCLVVKIWQTQKEMNLLQRNMKHSM